MGELDGFSNVACPTRKRLFVDKPITADEARKRSEASSKIMVEAELSEVYSEIFETAGAGKYEIKVNKLLSKEALNRLTELGYEYKPIGRQSMDEEFQQTGYQIYWNK